MKTIKDIAKEANVSPGTVDRVLHNRGGVSKKTEILIRELLEKNNFKINKVARLLALNKNLTIATLVPEYNTENRFWETPILGMNKAQEEVDVFGIKTHIYTFDQFKATSFLDQFNTLITSKPDAVVLVPSFKKETLQMVLKLEEKKIPYIFLNIDLDGCNNISYIGQDSYNSGYLAGKLMHLCLQKKDSIAIMQTLLNTDTNPAISKRINGFTDYFSNNNLPNIIIKEDLINPNNYENLKKKLNLILTNTPSIKGFYIPNSRASLFAKCFEDLKINDLSLIGFDATEKNVAYLKASKISFLISQKPFKQGYDSIKLMTNYLIEKKQPKLKISSPIEILTKENVSFS